MNTHNPAAVTYGIVGGGRVAANLMRYFKFLNLSFRQWSRARVIESPRNQENELKRVMSDCTHILLLISDSQIEPFIRAHPFLQTRALVHFSGSLVTDLAGGYHPLFSFAGESYDRQVYESIPFVCDAGIPAFNRVFPALPNPWITMDREMKPLYHALCVMGGNFTVLVWRKLFEEFESRLGIPPDFGTAYLRSITNNVIETPGATLTGPIARKDVETIRKNLLALKNDRFATIYRVVLETIDPELVKEIDL